MAFQEILLHVGLPKTGTTSIQRAFGEATAELRQHGSEKLVWIHVREDFKWGNRHFEAGDLLGVNILQANHDPDIFPHPEKFDWRRPLKRHLAFGIGAHHCLGAWLVRTETTILLEHLMRQPEILMTET